VCVARVVMPRSSWRQLQEARVLPLLRRPAHGRDRGAVGR
jgi:hypothetical protein